jgi:hypothetical protein
VFGINCHGRLAAHRQAKRRHVIAVLQHHGNAAGRVFGRGEPQLSAGDGLPLGDDGHDPDDFGLKDAARIGRERKLRL